MRMKRHKVYLNGKILPAHKATISVFDRGLFYGDGVFESLRTYRGKPFLLEEHLKRLLLGLKFLKIRPPLSLPQFKIAVLRTLFANKFKESYIKIIVTRGETREHGLDPSFAAGKPNVIILVEPLKAYPKSILVTGWKAVISRIIRANTPSSRIKSLCYLDNILAKMEASRAGANEAFLLDEKGNLVEGTTSNLFLVRNGIIYTPTQEEPLLKGITRDLIIKLARRSGFRVVEKVINPKELYSADECFVTSSGPGVVPITKIWDKKIGNGRCGPITFTLIKFYAAEANKI